MASAFEPDERETIDGLMFGMTGSIPRESPGMSPSAGPGPTEPSANAAYRDEPSGPLRR